MTRPQEAHTKSPRPMDVQEPNAEPEARWVPEKHKPVKAGFVDPCKGMVFPRSRRRRR